MVLQWHHCKKIIILFVCLCASCCEGALYWSRSGDRINAFTEQPRPGPAPAHRPSNWTCLLWKWWVHRSRIIAVYPIVFLTNTLDVSPVGLTIPLSFFASVLTQFSYHRVNLNSKCQDLDSVYPSTSWTCSSPDIMVHWSAFGIITSCLKGFLSL